MRKQVLKNPKSRDAAAAASKFTDALTHRSMYRITTNFDIWYKFDATDGGIAVAGEDGAVHVAGGETVYDTPLDSTKLYLHVMRASGVDAKVNIAEVDEV